MKKIPEDIQYRIASQVRALKGRLGVSGEAPVGGAMPLLLRRLGIILIEYPIRRTETHSFSALLLRAKTDCEDLWFLGLNTADYFDRQIFAIAHELYHFHRSTEHHIARDPAEQTSEEQNAEWFAAEFLLPLHVLKGLVIESFGARGKLPFSKQLLRFIARVQCEWRLPYKAVVKRLYECDAVDSDTCAHLLDQIDERDRTGLYWRIGMAMDSEQFLLLNTVTNCTGTDSANLENGLRNYEEGLISEEELENGLRLFGRSPEDFGIFFERNDAAPDGEGGDPA